MLGAPVVRELLAAGRRVRVVGRSSPAALGSDAGRVEFHRADVRKRPALVEAVAGCATVHVSLQGGPRPEEYLSVEGDGVANVVAAARETGVERITLLSGTIVAAIDGAMLAQRHAVPAQIFAKFCAEEAVESSGIPYTIYRASNFIDGLERSIHNGRAFVPGGSRLLFHWIDAAEFATVVAADHASPAAPSATLHVLGPERLSIAEAMSIFVEDLHAEARIVQLPRWLMSVIALFQPALRGGLEMLRFAEENGAHAFEGPRATSIRLRTTIADYCNAHRREPAADSGSAALRVGTA